MTTQTIPSRAHRGRRARSLRHGGRRYLVINRAQSRLGAMASAWG